MPEGQPLKEFAFEELVSHARSSDIAGWIYPKRNVSQAIGLLNKPRQAALNLWGWIAILTLIAGIIVPVASGNWLWALLVALAFFLWKSNRESMEQFFLEQLVEDKAYFEKIAQADMVRVVLKEGAATPSAIIRQQDEKPSHSEAGSAWHPGSELEQRQKLAEFDARLASARSRLRKPR